MPHGGAISLVRSLTIKIKSTQWRIDSSKLMFCLLCRDHTGDAYSRIGRINAENAMDLALIEQPNIVRRRTLGDSSLGGY